MTKRRFTHSAVAHTTHIGAPLVSSGSTASCALPAKTSSDMNSISGTPSPLLPMATPVTSPQAPMPMAVPTMSRAPRANSGWRQTGAAAEELLTRELSPVAVAVLPRAPVGLMERRGPSSSSRCRCRPPTSGRRPRRGSSTSPLPAMPTSSAFCAIPPRRPMPAISDRAPPRPAGRPAPTSTPPAMPTSSSSPYRAAARRRCRRCGCRSSPAAGAAAGRRPSRTSDTCSAGVSNESPPCRRARESPASPGAAPPPSPCRERVETLSPRFQPSAGWRRAVGSTVVSSSGSRLSWR